MEPRIDLITVLADDVSKMGEFYRDALGFRIDSESDHYYGLENKGVRFAICSREIMYQITEHKDYKERKSGQSFELAFPVDSADELDRVYAEIIAKGATPIKAPSDMPWSHRTAFFADPEGNIHELFAPKAR
ncbi:VOC family protein [Paenibacillus sp. Cedars]|uniref:VOC family protein n=1 Tax=Paenibacillus sp. Cedars TaxID=1980674 RepID=UPI0011639CF4|nr:VOC family protein [Paenibacillus sp. Cedars]AWP30750.1 glyoxalase [Paenibacillus sp. Cedars]